MGKVKEDATCKAEIVNSNALRAKMVTWVINAAQMWPLLNSRVRCIFKEGTGWVLGLAGEAPSSHSV